MAEGIKADLEYGDAAAKVGAMKQAILLIINGDTFYFRDLSSIIVRKVLPCEDLTVQKLVLLYLETVYKGEDIFGRVPPDTTLIRGYLLKNLQHRDEYIRGITLRLLSRLRDPDLLESLVESVLVNLYHRHRFVRRHAYTAAFAIYLWLPNGRQLLPDALDRVEYALPHEHDPATMRNAFFMLCVCARERAVAYLLANADRAVSGWPDMIQMVAISLIRGGCHCCLSDHERGRFINIIMSILSTCSNSSSVIYEAASALLSLCSEPVAVRAATNAYYHLLSSSNDKDVEFIVLERLNELRVLHDDVMMDVSIRSPSYNVMNVNRTLPVVEKVLLEDLAKTQLHKHEDSNERGMKLMQAIHA